MNLTLRPRENMPTLLLDQDHIIGTVKDPRYEQLLGNADRLRQQLDYLTFIIDNLSGVSIDTLEAHRVLDETRMEEM
jgi:hypothetical protein